MRNLYNHLYLQRVAITLIAVVVTLVLFAKGRQTGTISELTAFSYKQPDNSIMIQVSGDVGHPGMYRTTDKKMTIDAIFMAKPLCPSLLIPLQAQLLMPMQAGDAVHLICKSPDNKALVSKTSMKASQLLTIGLPLDLNTMSQEDFELLPGVGPALARRIVELRHKNGGLMMVDDLLQVNGIGEKKLEHLSHYFK